MFIKSFCIALGAVMFDVVPIAGAFTTSEPIPGIDIGVTKKLPRGIAVVQTTTDAMQIGRVVPDGPAKSYKGTLTR